MINNLFIVCPFSCMEPFLIDKFGENSYFFTANGSILDYQDSCYTAALYNFLENENIHNVYFVTDTSCRFIDAVINGDLNSGLTATEILQNIYQENYSSAFSGHSFDDQKLKLAELNTRLQASRILSSESLRTRILKRQISINCLVTAKNQNYIKKINIKL